MKWIYAAGLALGIVAGQASADVFKCKTSDGRTVFSNAGCGTEEGVAERPDLKINEVGRFAEGQDINRLRRDRAAAERDRKGQTVTIIRDTSGEDLKTVDGNIKRRLRLREEYQERVKRSDPSGVTLIRNNADEDNHQKAMRLRTESMEQYGR